MSTSRFRNCAAAIAVVIFGAACGAATAPANMSADAGLAFRLESLSWKATEKVELPLDDPRNDPFYRQAKALLEAAHRCDPGEVRYLPALADACQRLGDSAARLKVLTDWRTLQPDNRAAQLQIIGVYLSRMEDVFAKIAYLKDMVGRENLPADVRSVLAVICAALMREKLQDYQPMLDQAIKLDALNSDALLRKYELLPAGVPIAQRVDLLLAMLRANPAKADVIISLAHNLALVGLPEQSVEWFEVAGKIWGGKLPAPAWLQYASELLLAGKTDAARQQLDTLIKEARDFYAAIGLRCMLEPDDSRKAELRREARAALIRNLKQTETAMTTTRPTSQPAVAVATTRPALTEDDLKLPTPMVADAFRKAIRGQGEYLRLLGDLAFSDVFLDSWTEEAQALLTHWSALHKLLPAPTTQQARLEDDNARIFQTRMQGWIFLRQNRLDEARSKLSAVAAEDPMAALGLLRTYRPDEPAQAKAEAQKLLTANQDGVLGALIYSDQKVRELGAKITATDQARAVQESLAKFPREWLRWIDRPGDFFELTGQPAYIDQYFGEPLLAFVSVKNIGRYDLTIGQDGVLPADVVLSAMGSYGFDQTKKMEVCTAPLDERTVLKPGQGFSVAVRLDQKALGNWLNENPVPRIGVTVFVQQYFPFRQRVTREASPIRSLPDFVRGGLKSTKPRERMRNLDVVAAIYTVVQKDPAGLLTVIQESGLKADPETAVRAWAMLVEARNSQQPEPLVQNMLKDGAWQVRLLGVAASAAMSREQQTSTLKTFVASEADPTVKEFAQGRLQEITAVGRATTQPVRSDGSD